jgi:hypothetical protein
LVTFSNVRLATCHLPPAGLAAGIGTGIGDVTLAPAWPGAGEPDLDHHRALQRDRPSHSIGPTASSLVVR